MVFLIDYSIENQVILFGIGYFAKNLPDYVVLLDYTDIPYIVNIPVECQSKKKPTIITNGKIQTQ